MSLKVENIYKTYDKKSVLNGVSLYADDNRIVGLLGPNGAGKSTLMKIITGYVTPDSGQVEVCGEKIASSAIDYKKNIGYLPEHNPLYLDMYVKEYRTLRNKRHPTGCCRSSRKDRTYSRKAQDNPSAIEGLSPACRVGTGYYSQPQSTYPRRAYNGARPEPDYRDTATDSRLRQTTYGAVFDTYIARGRSNLPKSRTDRQRKYYIGT